MGFPASPSTGDEYTAPSGAVYEYTSYGTWKVAEGQTDFDALSVDDVTDLTDALDTDAAGILAKLVTVDGAGSTLDSDLLDGQQGSYYADIVARLGYTPFNYAHLVGAAVFFCQAAAPTGWTKVTSHNNKALRLVSGTGAAVGGSTPFTTVFGARTIAQANLPNIAPTITITDPGHTHPTSKPATNGTNAGGGSVITSMGAYGSTDSAVTGITATSSSINGGVSQTTMDFSVEYVDVIMCTKN